MQQGDIVLVRFPFSNVVDYKIRPALVVSNNDFNKTFDAWICPITSKNAEKCVPLQDAISEGQLNKESFASTTKITTMNSELFLKRLGKINKEKIAQIISEIKKNF